MKFKPFVIALLIIAASISANAQNEIKWETIQPDLEEFSIDTPVRLAESGKKDSKSSRRYVGSTADSYLYVFSDTFKKPENFPAIERFAKIAGKEIGNEIGPGTRREVSFKDEDNFYHTIIVLRTDTRVYIAQSVSRTEDDPIATRFISSFALTNIGAVPALEISEQPAKDLAESATEVINDGLPKNVGSGSGNAGKESIALPGVAPNPTVRMNENLRILTKPKPTYTDFARFYNMQGTVILKATFLSNAQIGTIQIVKSLPFGLTNKAIIAAKSIKFEPRINYGIPVSVVKSIEYSFVLY